MGLLQLFGNNLLPVFLAAGAGYLLAAKTRLDPRPISHLAFFILAPCLVFQAISDSRAPGEAVLRMVGFTVACQFGLAAIAAALVIAPLFGLEGAAYQAGTLQAAMPSAVLCIILATEYDAEPRFVTAVVFLTTLLSPLTLTPLLAWLGA